MSNLFPSPADGVMDVSPSSSLYPDLGGVDMEESDPLPPLQSTGKARAPPKRPPPPRSGSISGSLVVSPTMASKMTHSLPPTRSQTHPSLSPLQSISPLKLHEIRWFYQEPTKFWQPFNGHDSLALEESYQKLLVHRSSFDGLQVPVLGDMYEASIIEKYCKPIYWTGKDPWKILRGSWFEVSGDKWYPMDEQESARIEEEHCKTQWRSKARIDSDLQGLANGKKPGPPADSSKQCEVIVNKLSLEKYDVFWTADGCIFKQKKEIGSQLLSMVGEKLGKGQLYGATKLQRGYKEIASHENREPPIGHLVFIVHGIGQNMDASDINRDTASFRSACAQIAKKHFADEWHRRRVEFIPVEWRTWLTLDKGLINMITPHGLKRVRGLINDTIIDVMYYLSPKYGPEIMNGLHFSVHKQYKEFMNRNPTFNGTINIFAHSLGSVLVYDLLLETCEERGVEHRDPQGCTGCMEEPRATKVSAFISPAKPVDLRDTTEVRYNRSVQSFDSSLQSNYSQPLSPMTEEEDVIDFTTSGSTGGEESEEERRRREEEGRRAARMELEQLKRRVTELERRLGLQKPSRGLTFQVEHFFAVGSPLALFLLMREHDLLIKAGHRGAASLIPTSVCKRVHNMHHPSDPIAYRLEPLINKVYSQVKPVKLDSASSKPSKESVDLAQGPREEKTTSAPSKGWSLANFFSSSSATKKVVEPKYPDKVVDDDKVLRPEDRLKERLDFMLRESMTENSYLNSITAHLGYWTSQDTAMFVLLQIYSYSS